MFWITFRPSSLDAKNFAALNFNFLETFSACPKKLEWQTTRQTIWHASDKTRPKLFWKNTIVATKNWMDSVSTQLPTEKQIHCLSLPFHIENWIDFLSINIDNKWEILYRRRKNEKYEFLKLVFTFFWLALMVFSVFAAALIWVAAVRFEAVLTKGNINASAFSLLFRCLRNQKLTIVNSTKAANTNAVHRPIHTSIALKEV